MVRVLPVPVEQHRQQLHNYQSVDIFCCRAGEFCGDMRQSVVPLMPWWFPVSVPGWHLLVPGAVRGVTWWTLDEDERRSVQPST